MSSNEALRRAGVLFAKEVIWRVGYRYRRSEDKKPICIYSSRRGGSTLLMEVLAAAPGVGFSDQPFGIYTASPVNINYLPIFEYGQVISMDEEEELLVRRYLEGILEGRIVANAPWRLWRDGHWRKCERLVLKITDAKYIADWIDDNFQVHSIVMTRHPVAQALSVMRNGWLVTGKAFLRNAMYVKRYLNPELLKRCHDVYAKGSDLERHVLDWGLENLPLVECLKRRPHWLYVSYEDLVQYPTAVVEMLVSQLALGGRETMIRRLRKPSRSTRRSSTRRTRQEIEKGSTWYLRDRWRREVRADECRRAFRVLEDLGIELYGPDSSSPRHAAVGRSAFGDRGDGDV